MSFIESGSDVLSHAEILRLLRIKSLSREEEQDLIDAYRNKSDETALNRLIEAHLKLGSGPIELFTKQMIGDSLSLEATGGMYERTILVER